MGGRVSEKNGNFKIYSIATIVAVIVPLLTILAFAGNFVDDRVDKGVGAHEGGYELEQQKVLTEIKEDVATLKAKADANQRQLDVIQDQGQHTQELVEQLIRDN